MRQKIIDDLIHAGVTRFPATHFNEPILALSVKIAIGFNRCSDCFLKTEFIIIEDDEPLETLTQQDLLNLVKESYNSYNDYPAGWFVEEVYKDLLKRLVNNYTGVKELLAA